MDPVDTNPPPARKNRVRADLLLASFLALTSFFLTYRASHWDESLFYKKAAKDCWFDADPDRVLPIEIDRHAPNDRTAMHPLYPYVAYPIVFAVRKILPVSGPTASRVFHALVAAAWAGLYYGLLRRAALRRWDAVLFTLLAGTTAAAIFWLPFVETWSLGALSLMPALWMSAGPRRAGPVAFLVAGVCATGATVTNAMVGAFAALVRLPRRAALIVIVGFLLIAGALGALQPLFFPQSVPAAASAHDNLAWVFTVESGGPFAVMRTFFVSGVVAPELRFLRNWRQPFWSLLTMQFGGAGSGTDWARPAVVIWAGILGAGVAGLWKRRASDGLAAVVTLTLLYQLLLHLVYGHETFLYSMHYVPLLVLIAAHGCHTRARPWVLSAAAVLVVCLAVNNVRQFSWASAYVQRGPRLKLVQAEMDRRWKGPAPGEDPTEGYLFTRDVLGWK